MPHYSPPVSRVVERVRAVGVDRLAELIAAGTYGTVLVLGTLTAISAGDVSTGYGLELIAGVGAATWVAHLFAELLGGHVARQTPLDREEMVEAAVDGSPILAATVLPAATLLLSRLETVSDGTARSLAIAVGLTQLFAIVMVAGGLAPARRTTMAIFGVLTLAIGLVVVAITSWLH